MFRRVTTVLAVLVAIGLVGVWWVNRTHSWFRQYYLVEEDLGGSRVLLTLRVHSDGLAVEFGGDMPGSEFVDELTWARRQMGPVPAVAPTPAPSLFSGNANVQTNRKRAWFLRAFYVGGDSRAFVGRDMIKREGKPGYLMRHHVSARMAMCYPVLAVASLGWIGAMAAYGPVRRRWWRMRGRCVVCGYDLRASRDGCPECGAGVVDLSSER